MKRWLAIAAARLCVAFVQTANAHEVRPAFLELTERAPGEFDVLWKVPALWRRAAGRRGDPARAASASGRSGRNENDAVRLSGADGGAAFARSGADSSVAAEGCGDRGAAARRADLRRGDQAMDDLACANGLDGWEVTVHGLPATMVDVLVRIAFKDGRVVSRSAAAGCAVVCFSRERTPGRPRADISCSASSTFSSASIICSSSSRWCSSCAAWACS